jgi:hypothetical protein
MLSSVQVRVPEHTWHINSEGSIEVVEGFKCVGEASSARRTGMFLP